MAAPSYSTDLLPISACDALGTWVEPSATGWTQGAVPALDGENYIQGTGAISKAYNATGVGGMMFNYASGITIPSGSAFFLWVYWASPKTLATEANGGLRAICGNLANAFYGWTLGGNDTYIYGGWENYAVDPNVTADFTAGSPSGTWQWFGFCVNNLDAITKGNPCLTDAYYYGRGEMRINGGETGNYATFPGFAAQNDNGSYRWGLFRAIPGGYSWKGLMILGYASAVDFRDADRAIVVENTKKVASGFNKIEIRQSGSRVDWTRINISALGTVSRGALEVVDNADVNIDSCVFSDMGTFAFQGNSTVLNSTFRRCGVITQNGATFTGCVIDQGRETKAMAVSNISLVTNTGFISDGTGYAIEGFSSAGDYTLTGLNFTGYASGNGTTGNEAIHVLATSGIVNLNISGGNSPSIHTAGATVNVISSITLTLTGLQSGSDIVILDAGTSTERVNVNENSGSTYQFGYPAGDVGEYVDIGVFKAGYVPKYVRNYQLAATNASLPIAQEPDAYYIE
jgi:hypothetical protein